MIGAGRDHCVALLNIDLAAVGNWAERNKASPTAATRSCRSTRRCWRRCAQHVAEVNAGVAADPMLSGCQIHRFLVLHKELDADDGELTRTRKVRRAVIGEKFADLIAALYSGAPEIYTETEVTYEDGRKGQIKATLQIQDAEVVAVEPRRMAAE